MTAENFPVQIIMNVKGRYQPILMTMIRDMYEQGIDFLLLPQADLSWLYQPEPFDGTMVIFSGAVWIRPVQELVAELKRRGVPHQLFSNYRIDFVARSHVVSDEAPEDEEDNLPNMGDLELLATIVRRKQEAAEVADRASDLSDLADTPSAEEIESAKEVLGSALDYDP